MTDLTALRVDLAVRSKWNVGYLWAGATYWSFAAVVGSILPMDTAIVYWMAGSCGIFPLALLLSRFAGADPFMHGNTLGSVIGMAHGGLIAVTVPVMIAMFREYPPGLPLVAGIYLGASFPVLCWAFGDQMFLWHFLLRSGGTIVLWFALPGQRFSALPAFVAGMYVLTALVLPRRRAAWLSAHAPQRL